MGKISELINQMIQRMLESSEWTSANPTHVNTFIQANSIDNPDFEREIKNLGLQFGIEDIGLNMLQTSRR